VDGHAVEAAAALDALAALPPLTDEQAAPAVAIQVCHQLLGLEPGCSGGEEAKLAQSGHGHQPWRKQAAAWLAGPPKQGIQGIEQQRTCRHTVFAGEAP